MQLSVVLATYNEEANLKSCLKSIKDLAQEIIIVDGKSQDNTLIIAKSYHATVFQVPNDPMFHRLKQMAVDKANGKWILQLDADEIVTDKLSSEINTIVRENTSQYQGYYIPRKNWFLGKFLSKGGQYPDYVIRLFKKGKGHFPQKSVHEQIIIDGKVGYFKNDLIHNADPSLDKYLLRFNRYTSFDADHLHQQYKKPSLVLLVNYCFVKPIYWFMLTFIRHRGYVNGLQGFLFSLFSSIRYIVIYLKFYERSVPTKRHT